MHFVVLMVMDERTMTDKHTNRKIILSTVNVKKKKRNYYLRDIDVKNL